MGFEPIELTLEKLTVNSGHKVNNIFKKYYTIIVERPIFIKSNRKRLYINIINSTQLIDIDMI